MIRKIVTWPDDRLRKKTSDILVVGDKERTLYQDLCDSMTVEDGLGIAAPQVGETVSMFVISGDLELTYLSPRPSNKAVKAKKPVCFVNPKILWSSDEKTVDVEGCLSFPGRVASVERSNMIHMEALDLKGRSFVVEAKGLSARCLLHEADHLSGRLLKDYGLV